MTPRAMLSERRYHQGLNTMPPAKHWAWFYGNKMVTGWQSAHNTPQARRFRLRLRIRRLP